MSPLCMPTMKSGYLLPIKEIAEVLKHHPTAYHVDAVQIMGKLPVYPEELGIDFMSASAHKFHGPKGIGFMYFNHVKFDKFYMVEIKRIKDVQELRI